MAKRQLKLVFPTDAITQPVVYDVCREFRLVSHIHRATIQENRGVVMLGLEGDDADIEKAMAWVADKGIEVEPLEVETIQP